MHFHQWSLYDVHFVVCTLCSDPDGWKGVFTRGHEQSLIWKEGEVYLLPYREENGFYKAPGRTTNIHLFLEHVGVGLLWNYSRLFTRFTVCVTIVELYSMLLLRIFFYDKENIFKLNLSNWFTCFTFNSVLFRATLLSWTYHSLWFDCVW